MTFPPPTERQARVIWVAISGLAIALIATLFVTLFWALGRTIDTLSPVLWPLAVAAVIACLLDPAVDWLEAHGRSRRVSIAAVFAIAFLLLLGFLASVVPQLIDETRQLASTIPEYSSRLQKRIQDWANKPPAIVQDFLRYRNRARTPEPQVPPVTNTVTIPSETFLQPTT